MKVLFLPLTIALAATPWSSHASMATPEPMSAKATATEKAEKATTEKAKTAHATAVKALPLRVLVQHALEAQPTVAIASYETERRHQETNMSKASLYPTLDITSEASQTKSPSESHEQNIESKAMVNYRITDFGVRSNNIDKSKSIEQSSKYDFQQSMIGVANQTTTTYLTIAKLEKILAAIDEDRSFYKKMLSDFSELINAGVAMQSDMRKVQVSIDSLSTQELNYRAQLDTELSKLRNLTGDTIEPQQALMVPELFDKYKFDTNKQNVMTLISKNNFNYMSLHKNIEAAQFDLAAAKSSNYPTVDFNAGYTDNQPSSNVNADDYKDEFKFGVKVGLNLFNGFKNQSEASKFSARYMQSKLELDDFILTTRNAIDATNSKYQANTEALAIAERSYENTSKLTELYKEEFKLGQKSLLDLISSRGELFQAQVTVIESTYGIYQSKLEQMTLVSGLLHELQLTGEEMRPGSRSLLQ